MLGNDAASTVSRQSWKRGIQQFHQVGYTLDELWVTMLEVPLLFFKPKNTAMNANLLTPIAVVNRARIPANRMPDKFKCPNCGSGRTKPLSIAITAGTRRRRTVGISRRSLWSSASTYKSDFVSGLPQRPSNAGAYLCIFLGVCGLLFAWFVGANIKDAGRLKRSSLWSVLYS